MTYQQRNLFILHRGKKFAVENIPITVITAIQICLALANFLSKLQQPEYSFSV
jgi:hypothetical protein